MNGIKGRRKIGDEKIESKVEEGGRVWPRVNLIGLVEVV